MTGQEVFEMWEGRKRDRIKRLREYDGDGGKENEVKD